MASTNLNKLRSVLSALVATSRAHTLSSDRVSKLLPPAATAARLFSTKEDDMNDLILPNELKANLLLKNAKELEEYQPRGLGAPKIHANYGAISEQMINQSTAIGMAARRALEEDIYMSQTARAIDESLSCATNTPADVEHAMPNLGIDENGMTVDADTAMSCDSWGIEKNEDSVTPITSWSESKATDSIRIDPSFGRMKTNSELWGTCALESMMCDIHPKLSDSPNVYNQIPKYLTDRCLVPTYSLSECNDDMAPNSTVVSSKPSDNISQRHSLPIHLHKRGYKTQVSHEPFQLTRRDFSTVTWYPYRKPDSKDGKPTSFAPAINDGQSPGEKQLSPEDLNITWVTMPSYAKDPRCLPDGSKGSGLLKTNVSTATQNNPDAAFITFENSDFRGATMVPSKDGEGVISITLEDEQFNCAQTVIESQKSLPSDFSPPKITSGSTNSSYSRATEDKFGSKLDKSVDIIKTTMKSTDSSTSSFAADSVEKCKSDKSVSAKAEETSKTNVKSQSKSFKDMLKNLISDPSSTTGSSTAKGLSETENNKIVNLSKDKQNKKGQKEQSAQSTLLSAKPEPMIALTKSNKKDTLLSKTKPIISTITAKSTAVKNTPSLSETKPELEPKTENIKITSFPVDKTEHQIRKHENLQPGALTGEEVDALNFSILDGPPKSKSQKDKSEKGDSVTKPVKAADKSLSTSPKIVTSSNKGKDASSVTNKSDQTKVGLGLSSKSSTEQDVSVKSTTTTETTTKTESRTVTMCPILNPDSKLELKISSPTKKSALNADVKPSIPASKSTLNPNAKPFIPASKSNLNPNATPATPASKSTLNPNAEPFIPASKSTLNPNAKPFIPASKSTLNPNAKPFIPASKSTLNPNAKPFIPASKSTLNPNAKPFIPASKSTLNPNAKPFIPASKSNQGTPASQEFEKCNQCDEIIIKSTNTSAYSKNYPPLSDNIYPSKSESLPPRSTDNVTTSNKASDVPIATTNKGMTQSTSANVNPTGKVIQGSIRITPTNIGPDKVGLVLTEQNTSETVKNIAGPPSSNVSSTKHSITSPKSEALRPTQTNANTLPKGETIIHASKYSNTAKPEPASAQQNAGSNAIPNAKQPGVVRKFFKKFMDSNSSVSSKTDPIVPLTNKAKTVPKTALATPKEKPETRSAKSSSPTYASIVSKGKPYLEDSVVKTKSKAETPVAKSSPVDTKISTQSKPATSNSMANKTKSTAADKNRKITILKRPDSTTKTGSAGPATAASPTSPTGAAESKPKSIKTSSIMNNKTSASAKSTAMPTTKPRVQAETGKSSNNKTSASAKSTAMPTTKPRVQAETDKSSKVADKAKAESQTSKSSPATHTTISKKGDSVTRDSMAKTKSTAGAQNPKITILKRPESVSRTEPAGPATTSPSSTTGPTVVKPKSIKSSTNTGSKISSTKLAATPATKSQIEVGIGKSSQVSAPQINADTQSVKSSSVTPVTILNKGEAIKVETTIVNNGEALKVESVVNKANAGAEGSSKTVTAVKSAARGTSQIEAEPIKSSSKTDISERNKSATKAEKTPSEDVKSDNMKKEGGVVRQLIQKVFSSTALPRAGGEAKSKLPAKSASVTPVSNVQPQISNTTTSSTGVITKSEIENKSTILDTSKQARKRNVEGASNKTSSTIKSTTMASAKSKGQPGNLKPEMKTSKESKSASGTSARSDLNSGTTQSKLKTSSKTDIKSQSISITGSKTRTQHLTKTQTDSTAANRTISENKGTSPSSKNNVIAKPAQANIKRNTDKLTTKGLDKTGQDNAYKPTQATSIKTEAKYGDFRPPSLSSAEREGEATKPSTSPNVATVGIKSESGATKHLTTPNITNTATSGNITSVSESVSESVSSSSAKTMTTTPTMADTKPKTSKSATTVISEKIEQAKNYKPTQATSKTEAKDREFRPPSLSSAKRGGEATKPSTSPNVAPVGTKTKPGTSLSGTKLDSIKTNSDMFRSVNSTSTPPAKTEVKSRGSKSSATISAEGEKIVARSSTTDSVIKSSPASPARKDVKCRGSKSSTTGSAEGKKVVAKSSTTTSAIKSAPVSPAKTDIKSRGSKSATEISAAGGKVVAKSSTTASEIKSAPVTSAKTDNKSLGSKSSTTISAEGGKVYNKSTPPASTLTSTSATPKTEAKSQGSKSSTTISVESGEGGKALNKSTPVTSSTPEVKAEAKKSTSTTSTKKIVQSKSTESVTVTRGNIQETSETTNIKTTTTTTAPVQTEATTAELGAKTNVGQLPTRNDSITATSSTTSKLTSTTAAKSGTSSFGKSPSVTPVNTKTRSDIPKSSISSDKVNQHRVTKSAQSTGTKVKAEPAKYATTSSTKAEKAESILTKPITSNKKAIESKAAIKSAELSGKTKPKSSAMKSRVEQSSNMTSTMTGKKVKSTKLSNVDPEKSQKYPKIKSSSTSTTKSGQTKSEAVESKNKTASQAGAKVEASKRSPVKSVTTGAKLQVKQPSAPKINNKSSISTSVANERNKSKSVTSTKNESKSKATTSLASTISGPQSKSDNISFESMQRGAKVEVTKPSMVTPIATGTKSDIGDSKTAQLGAKVKVTKPSTVTPIVKTVENIQKSPGSDLPVTGSQGKTTMSTISGAKLGTSSEDLSLIFTKIDDKKSVKTTKPEKQSGVSVSSTNKGNKTEAMESIMPSKSKDAIMSTPGTSAKSTAVSESNKPSMMSNAPTFDTIQPNTPTSTQTGTKVTVTKPSTVDITVTVTELKQSLGSTSTKTADDGIFSATHGAPKPNAIPRIQSSSAISQKTSSIYDTSNKTSKDIKSGPTTAAKKPTDIKSATTLQAKMFKDTKSESTTSVETARKTSTTKSTSTSMTKPVKGTVPKASFDTSIKRDHKKQETKSSVGASAKNELKSASAKSSMMAQGKTRTAAGADKATTISTSQAGNKSKTTKSSAVKSDAFVNTTGVKKSSANETIVSESKSTKFAPSQSPKTKDGPSSKEPGVVQNMLKKFFNSTSFAPSSPPRSATPESPTTQLKQTAKTTESGTKAVKSVGISAAKSTTASTTASTKQTSQTQADKRVLSAPTATTKNASTSSNKYKKGHSQSTAYASDVKSTKSTPSVGSTTKPQSMSSTFTLKSNSAVGDSKNAPSGYSKSTKQTTDTKVSSSKTVSNASRKSETMKPFYKFSPLKRSLEILKEKAARAAGSSQAEIPRPNSAKLERQINAKNKNTGTTISPQKAAKAIPKTDAAKSMVGSSVPKESKTKSSEIFGKTKSPKGQETKQQHSTVQQTISSSSKSGSTISAAGHKSATKSTDALSNKLAVASSKLTKQTKQYIKPGAVSSHATLGKQAFVKQDTPSVTIEAGNFKSATITNVKSIETMESLAMGTKSPTLITIEVEDFKRATLVPSKENLKGGKPIDTASKLGTQQSTTGMGGFQLHSGSTSSGGLQHQSESMQYVPTPQPSKSSDKISSLNFGQTQPVTDANLTSAKPLRQALSSSSQDKIESILEKSNPAGDNITEKSTDWVGSALTESSQKLTGNPDSKKNTQANKNKPTSGDASLYEYYDIDAESGKHRLPQPKPNKK